VTEKGKQGTLKWGTTRHKWVKETPWEDSRDATGIECSKKKNVDQTPDVADPLE